jgi:hypothetical protein
LVRKCFNGNRSQDAAINRQVKFHGTVVYTAKINCSYFICKLLYLFEVKSSTLVQRNAYHYSLHTNTVMVRRLIEYQPFLK